MSEHELNVAGALEQDLHQLEQAWRPVREAELPADLTARTLRRLKTEGLLVGAESRSTRLQRWTVVGSVAAALMLVIAGSFLQPAAKWPGPMASDWAADLELELEFESLPEELEYRLDRVQQLLAEEGSEESLALDEADSLRQHMESLSTEMEAF